MFTQIRKLMGEELRLGGAGTPGVEMDEMYQGGRRKDDAGRMLRGNKGKARQLFLQALSLDPGNKKAKDALNAQ